MHYRTLAKGDVRVSEIGLGTWPIGGSIRLGGAPTGWGQVPESEARRGLERALDLGINFFDTSDSYGLGRAERLLGQVVSGRRGQVVLATKVGWVPDGVERWVADTSPDHLRAAVERSLRRLDTDVVDLLWLHAVPDEGDATDAALDTLEELRTLGRIRLIGASVGWEVEAGRRLVATGRLDALQVHYSLLHQGAAELLDEALSRRTSVVASSPLAYGFLGGRYTRATRFGEDDWRSRLTPEEIGARVERVGELRQIVAGAGERSLTHAALRFVLAHPAVVSAIPGFRSAEQVEDLAAAADTPPPSDIEIARARELGRSWSARSTLTA
jgi:aryl-alcohol dehydrogenase-like predicted oxidoreductase